MSTALPTTQKALVIYDEGKPFTVGETPVPRPGPGEVLVKVLACALNPADNVLPNIPPPLKSLDIIKFVSLKYPLIAGYDGAGIVVERGAEVTNLKEGDRVLFAGHFGTPSATFQQYASVPAEFAAIIPDNVTFEQAATIPLALTTDVLLLYNQSPAPENLTLRLKPFWEPEGANAYAGSPAFIVGGAASLGQYAIQLAKLAGHHPIITTASPHNAELLKSFGATHVLDRSRSNESILAELPTLTGGKPINLTFAAVLDPQALRLGRDALAPGGALALVTAVPYFVPEEISNPGDGKRAGFVYGSGLLPYYRDTTVTLFKQITGWLEKGLVKPNPVEVLPNGLAGILEGLERLRDNKVSGKKLVARPQESTL
ncbi:GroES-like protein [Pilatotrama ljubarskyi]|nr:GroES-like protein [Pilatotrama ljubarskyi]